MIVLRPLAGLVGVFGAFSVLWGVGYSLMSLLLMGAEGATRNGLSHFFYTRVGIGVIASAFAVFLWHTSSKSAAKSD